MIGEFCPKVFPLRGHVALRLKTIVLRCAADASAGIVNSLG